GPNITYYKINGGATQTGTAILLTSSGTYTVKYWSVDNAGNTEQDTSIPVKIDKGKPAVSLSSPAACAALNTNTPTLSWTGSDDASGISYYEVQVDNNNNFASPEFTKTTSSTSTTTNSLPDNTYYWRVRAVDDAGNVGDWQSRSFTISTGPPTNLNIKINNNAQFTNSTSVTLTLSASQNAYEMCFSNDNSSWSSWEAFANTKSWTLQGSADGTKTVYFKCRNLYGNESEVVNDTIVLDTTPPSLQITKPQSGTMTNKENITVEGEVRDLNGIEKAEILVNVSVYSLTLVDGNFSQLVKLSNGTNIVKLRAKDNAGNRAEKTIAVTYDPTVPTLIIYTPQNNSITNNSQCLVSGKTGAGCVVFIDRVSIPLNSSYEFSKTVILTEGLNTINITAINLVSTGRTVLLHILFDSIAPSPPSNLSIAPSDWSRSNNFTVSWDAQEDEGNISGAWYKLNYQPCSNNDGIFVSERLFTIQLFEEGSQVLYLWLQDKVGNTNYNNFSTALIKYDCTPPANEHALNGLHGNNDWWLSNLSITLAPVDNLSGIAFIKYRINNSSWEIYTGKIILSEGLWLVEYFAVDNAGNIAPKSQVYVKIDLTAPENVIIQNIPRYINTSNITLSWSESRDELSGLRGYRVECNNNLTYWVNATNCTLNLLEGVYNIRIAVSDLAGNIWQSDFITLICDLTPPTTNILLSCNCSHEELFGSEVKVEFYFGKDTCGIKETRYRIDNDKWQAYNSSFLLEKDGKYTIEYYSIDFAGNVEQPKAKLVVINRALFAPTVKLLAPSENAEITCNTSCFYNASSPLNESVEIKVMLFGKYMKAIILENCTNTGWFLLEPAQFINGRYILEITVSDGFGRYSTDKINISIKNRLIIDLKFDSRAAAVAQRIPISVTICNYYAHGYFYIGLYINDTCADLNCTPAIQEFECATFYLFCTVGEKEDCELSVKLFNSDKEFIEERKAQLKILSEALRSENSYKPILSASYFHIAILVLVTTCLAVGCLKVRAEKRRKRNSNFEIGKVKSLDEVNQEFKNYEEKLKRRWK
ncbi:MAG: Ig-like domain-containing protein, partial [Candidatus Thermoplasmatota archaeon]|nr:Ig-like domain-containing protein [Candidatus Thermoplasmatota archaeon]